MLLTSLANTSQMRSAFCILSVSSAAPLAHEIQYFILIFDKIDNFIFMLTTVLVPVFPTGNVILKSERLERVQISLEVWKKSRYLY